MHLVNKLVIVRIAFVPAFHAPNTQFIPYSPPEDVLTTDYHKGGILISVHSYAIYAINNLFISSLHSIDTVN